MKLKSLQNKGIISIYVILLLILYSSIGLTLLSLQMGAFQDSMNLQDTVQAKYLAQTALQEARYYAMNIGTSWTGTSSEFTLTIDGKSIGTYKYTTAIAGNAYTITAYGYVPNSTAKNKSFESITYTFWNPNPQIIFQDGFETGDLNSWAGESNDVGGDWDVTNVAAKNGTYHARGRRISGSGTKVARLLTPIYNLNGYGSVYLRFVWRAYNGGVKIVVSQDSGSGWSQIYSNSTNTYDSAYTRPAIRLNISNLTSTVQFRFEASNSNNSTNYFIDDIQLVAPYSVFDATVD